MDAGFIKTGITLSIKLTRFLEINKLRNVITKKLTFSTNRKLLSIDRKV